MKRKGTRISLTEQDEKEIRYIYLNEWKEYGAVGGPTVWTNVVVRYLITNGKLPKDFIEKLKEESSD